MEDKSKTSLQMFAICKLSLLSQFHPPAGGTLNLKQQPCYILGTAGKRPIKEPFLLFESKLNDIELGISGGNYINGFSEEVREIIEQFEF